MSIKASTLVLCDRPGCGAAVDVGKGRAETEAACARMGWRVIHVQGQTWLRFCAAHANWHLPDKAAALAGVRVAGEG